MSECRIRKIQLRIPLFLKFFKYFKDKSRIFDTKQKKWLLILKVASKISNKLKVIVSIISITPLLSSEEMTTSCGWHRFYHCSRCWMYWDILHMQKAALGHITVSHWDISFILVRLRGRERASGSWLNWGSHTFTTMIGQFTELESRFGVCSRIEIQKHSNAFLPLFPLFPLFLCFWIWIESQLCCILWI